MSVVFLAALALAVAPPAYNPPRTPDGHPNLQGDWTNDSLTQLERDDYFDSLAPAEDKVAAFETMINDPKLNAAYRAERRKKADKPAPLDIGQQESEWFDYSRLARVNGQPRSSHLTDPADGELPMAKAPADRMRASFKRFARVFDNPEDRDIFERCLITNAGGPPLGNEGTNPNYRIVQTKDAVAIETETEHDVRIIRIGGAHGGVAEWMGDSVGVWQGDTLRVETTGFPPAYAQPIGFDFLLSAHAKVTEWFTRIGATTILYRFQVDDPETYTRPWRGEMELRSGKGVREYACHEGNYSLPGILAGARAWERQGKTPEPLDGGDPPPKPKDSPAKPAS